MESWSGVVEGNGINFGVTMYAFIGGEIDTPLQNFTPYNTHS